ncbi:PP2C family serine/threonine-protein phosphatase [Oleiagrimonas sp.]|jgi:serine/threonine protein phosphatase PrpC|uniref:PP2C family protein-serine/threonine phosphatase n=1 Tax=Oleiagrimonas sp. TaxID=2010330 RepID=UPI002602916A|nr:PP2C family serine/threonine-protein phosphatase [Oleiagrimonas sp.]MDA3915313.1 serine/threonine-protein phosphatase [Oleiagrimonas sp.]
MTDADIEYLSFPRISAGRARGGREAQQDALVCLNDSNEGTSLLVVADGMGGDGAGELAAEGVIAVARRLWNEDLWRSQPAPMFLEILCQEAHEELIRRRQALMYGEPHSTIVALLLRGDRASWVHVGDSRLYCFMGSRCTERTLDHSLAQLKVTRGQIRPEQIPKDPDQHKLLRGLGGDVPPEVEHGGSMLHPGQTFVLCSDGIWEHLTTRELGQMASRDDHQQAMRELLAVALERGGDDSDNAAVVLARTSDAGRFRRLGAQMWSTISDTVAGRRGDAVA